jgi:hypothetical protein
MFDEADRAQLARVGIAEAEIDRQLTLFANPPAPTILDRPCTIDDGITVLTAAAHAAALAACDDAVRAGRVLKFVPASGAATRMFQDLLASRADREVTRAALAARAPGVAAARETLTFFDNAHRFAFAPALDGVLRYRGTSLADRQRAGDVGAVLRALLDRDGLGYAVFPKGLIPFHRYADESRTAFEEHLVEGAVLGRRGPAAHVHLTVSPEHERDFRALLARAAPHVSAQYGAPLEVEFSHQQPATDTIAVDLENRPFRTGDGRLLFRPGGHGALVNNLDALRADVIYIKNIDNIPPDHLRPPVVDCARLLIGHVVAVQRELFRHRAALDGGRGGAAAATAAAAFLRDVLHVDAAPGDRRALCALLDRPLRVCGMVRNTGEPGGGPFWVRDGAGRCTLQIVESAQIDRTRPEQRAVFAAATHFNPVVMACAVRDWRGKPFDLHDFVDPSAVFIAEKSKDGRPLKALERPGLWNGGMAHWNTIFVDVPDATFTPVKTVNDLLRPAHQQAGAPPLDTTGPGAHSPV